MRYNNNMSEKQKETRKKYWASITPAQRSQRMRDIAKKRQAKLSFEERRQIAIKMVMARRKKKIII